MRGANVAIFVAAISFSIIGSAQTASPTGSSAAELEIFHRVKSLYTQGQNAIESIECNYVYYVNDAGRECHYMRNGEKKYHASLVLGPDGQAIMAMEAGWDGQRSYLRPASRYVSQSASAADFHSATPVPEDAFLTYVDGPLDRVPRPDKKFSLVHARMIKASGQSTGPAAELEFEGFGGTLLLTFGQSVGYWPISAKLIAPNGSIEYEMTARYASVESHGNVLYYPKEISAVRHPPAGVVIAGAEGSGDNAIRWEVDTNSLKLNEPISNARFALRISPGDTVWDKQTRRTKPPANPQWVSANPPEFPWNLVATAALKPGSKNLALIDPALIASTSSPWMERSGTWIAAAGLIVMVFAFVAIYRQRRGAS